MKKKYLIEITEEDVNTFIQFCDKNYLSSLYYNLYQLEYAKWNYFSIISLLASFTISFEGFLRTIIDETDKKKSRSNLKDILKLFFEKSNWWDTLDVNWAALTNSKDNLEMLINKIENTNLAEIVKTFLVIGALRNNIAHNVFGVYFIKKSPRFYVEKIAEAIWYTWVYINNLKNSSTHCS